MSVEIRTSTVPKPRLWVVSEPFYPEENTTSVHLTRFAEGLSETFEVHVLCGQPSYSSRGTKAPKLENRKGVEIHRSAGTTLNKDVFTFRLLNMATLGLSTFFKAATSFRQGDRVLVVTAPPTLQFICAIASMLRGANYTLLMYDNFPEVLIAAGKIRADSFISAVIAFLNRWLMKHARSIVVIGRDMKVLLEEKTGGLDIPIEIIPNCADVESIKPAPKSENALLKRLNLAHKFVLLYAGNIGRTHDIETIVECADMLKDQSEIHFVFLGDGGKKVWLRDEVTIRRLKNVTVLDPLPSGQKQTFMTACDVSLISLMPGMNGVSVPSRTYNTMAAGKPILAITQPGSELEMIVNEERIGWISPPRDAETLKQKILQIKQIEAASLAEMSVRARTAAESKYTFAHAVRKYEATLM